MNNDLNQKVIKKLPKASDFTKLLLSEGLYSDELGSIDFAKLERDEIDFWLWQVGANLSYLYEQKPTKNLAIQIKKVIKAQDLNKANSQKKFVFYSLLG